jgi:hypothetical protein
MRDVHRRFDLSDVPSWSAREPRVTERDDHDRDLDDVLVQLWAEQRRARTRHAS